MNLFKDSLILWIKLNLLIYDLEILIIYIIIFFIFIIIQTKNY